jgi:uncharacterized protein YdaU (DUF1376 family)
MEAKQAKIVGTERRLNASPSLTTPQAERVSELMATSDSTPGKSPAFQFYPNDFLSDPNVIAMSLPERGAYITLICLCWQNPLPDDVDRLARLCGVQASAFRKLWPALSRCFRPDAETPGVLIHPRLERERAKQDVYRRRQSDNGKNGGRPRKATPNPEKPTALSGLSQTEPTPNPEKALRSSSSIFDLQSSDFGQKRERARGAGNRGGLMAGTLPGDHLNCRQPCVRVCVSNRQHGILKAKFGGDDAAADAALDAFYAEVRARLPETPIGDKPWAFWDAQFAAKYGTATTTVNTRTAGNAGALSRFVARGGQS